MFSYLCIKFLYLTNAIGQLYLMKNFLGYSEDMVGFGLIMATTLVSRVEWEESLYFSQVAINVRQMGQKSRRYTGMCALAINMLNEKLYVFLWFWTLAVAISTAVSIINWLLRLAIRRHQASVIRRHLNLTPLMLDSKKSSTDSSTSSTPSDVLDPNKSDTVERFIRDFLRMDGVFIVQMLNMNAGDVIAGEVIRLLWHTWVTKYANKDFNNDPCIDVGYSYDMDEIDREKMALSEKAKL